MSLPPQPVLPDAGHAVVDKNKINGAKTETEDEPTVIKKMICMPCQ